LQSPPARHSAPAIACQYQQPKHLHTQSGDNPRANASPSSGTPRSRTAPKSARAGAKLKAQVDDPAGEAAAWHPTTHPPCGQAISPSQPMQGIALALALRLELRSFP